MTIGVHTTSESSLVVGVSVDHDGGCCFLRGGDVVVALSEERVTRKKYARGFGSALLRAVQYSGIPLSDSQAFVFVNNGSPLATGYTGSLELLGVAPHACHNAGHHLAHACTAFYGSPFDRSLVLVVDGEGNTGEAESCYIGEGNHLKSMGIGGQGRVSLGIGRVYEAFTNLLGWTYQDAGKTMALAGYGDPSRFARHHLFHIQGLEVCSSLSYESMEYQHAFKSLKTSMGHSGDLLACKFAPCAAYHVLTQQPGIDLERILQRQELAADIAAYVQRELEDILVVLVRRLVQRTGIRTLCFAGGVALNVTANRAILEDGCIDQMYIPPAANDRGLPLGGALYGRHLVLGITERVGLRTDFLGPEYSENDISMAIAQSQRRLGGFAKHITVIRPKNMAQAVAKLIAAGKTVGRFQGRGELGPRALGNRSILADPRSRRSVEYLNDHVKKREPFRPYAASVLSERASDCFDGCVESPFMLVAAKVRASWAKRIPAVVHVDGSCRVQTVDSVRTPGLKSIIKEFLALTGVPLILNTSFNEAGHAIVESPRDALECFLRTGLECLELGPFLLTKRVSDLGRRDVERVQAEATNLESV